MSGPGDPILTVSDVVHQFPSGRGIGGGGRKGSIHALRGVSLDLYRGECLALVGESGSGKTTLARVLLRLIQPTGGMVLHEGRNVLTLDRPSLLAFRKRAQIVFQDPFGSLNPRLRAGPMLEEVLKVHGGDSTVQARKRKASELLELVGLRPDHFRRYPHEFSGGQRQRLGIARALAVGPEILILDEPVSSLDLSVQAQILNLLRELQESLALTLLLIAHDLSVVRHLAHRVVVLYLGRIVENSPAEELFRDPFHPYTRGLLTAANPGRVLEVEGGDWMPLPGEPPSPASPPPGCAFHSRCPHPEKDRDCELREPELGARTKARQIACWKEMGTADKALT